jgi:hypothetical protein
MVENENYDEQDKTQDHTKLEDTDKSLNYPSFKSIEELTKSYNLNESVNEANKSDLDIDVKFNGEECYLEIEDKGETKSYYVFGYGFYSYHTFQISLISKASTKLLSFRRYKHFVLFLHFMRKKYPYLIIPDIPPKNILGNISIKMISKEDFEKERIFGLSYFLNYLYNIKIIKDSIEFKKFLYDAYFDDNFFEQLQPFYTIPNYEQLSLQGKMYNYFTSLFTKNQLIIHNKEEMDILFTENHLKTLYRWIVSVKEQFVRSVFK